MNKILVSIKHKIILYLFVGKENYKASIINISTYKFEVARWLICFLCIALYLQKRTNDASIDLIKNMKSPLNNEHIDWSVILKDKLKIELIKK